MKKIRNRLQHIRIEYFVLASLIITIVGFMTNYYRFIVFEANSIYRNMLEHYFVGLRGNPTNTGIVLFVILIIAHLFVLYMISYRKRYTPNIRAFFIITVSSLLIIFLLNWGHLIEHNNYVFYDRGVRAITVGGITAEFDYVESYGFAFFWFFITLPVLTFVAFTYKQYRGPGEASLYGELLKKSSKKRKKKRT